jgi:catechol 2,3-dioxygenase-like lactoylglutathione lyase family enzyme
MDVEASLKVKSLSWVGVSTDNFDRSMGFFRDVLGLEVWVESEQQAILKTASGQQVEIFGGKGHERERNASPVVAFEVDNIEMARDELSTAGVELIGDIERWDGFAWQYFRSPDGHIFEIKMSPD